MKILACLGLLAIACPAFGQLSSLPETSLDDGVMIHPFADQNSAWLTSALIHYRLSSDNPFPAPSQGWTDAFGKTWTRSAPDISDVQAHGGTLRLIALGSPGGWLQDIGYAYSGLPSAGDSFTLAFGDGSTDPTALQFGDTIEVPLIPGDLPGFDYWFNSSIGTYTLFHPSNSTGAIPEIFWTASPFLVSTYIPSEDAWMDEKTWIGSVSEPSADGDHVFRFALQEFVPSGLLFADPAVPEPTTYGSWAAGALLGVIVWRRARRQREAIS